MNKVISLSLFGRQADTYAKYVRAYVRGHLNLFPLAEGWKLRIHTDSWAAQSDTGKLLQRYRDAGLVDLRIMYRDFGPGDDFPPPSRCKGMAWRLDPVFEAGVDYVFCRDLDAPPMPRDRACIDQFILSQATVHTIHDSDQHVGIMGGLCGFWVPRFREQTGLKSLEDIYIFANLTDVEWDVHGTDQLVLNRICLRPGGPLLLEHRYNGWWNGPGVRPAKAASEYACEAYSTRTPNEGVAKWPRPKGNIDWRACFTINADHLGAHLGCAGYDHEDAVKFWDEHGDEEITLTLAKCEAV